mgnify:CR=1 FL=1
MKTTAHYSQVPQTERPMDSFPKPNTIPDGWDLSEMLTAAEAGFESPTEPNTAEETGSDTWDNR